MPGPTASVLVDCEASTDYFGDLMVNRQRLVWAVATRRQLERWERIVARIVLGGFAGDKPEGLDVWSAEIERHFALVAGRNLLRALELDPPSTVAVEPTLRDELREGRDLQEHWPDNMPIFNAWPRPAAPPRPSGKSFAACNPERTPYGQFDWTNKTGARLLPNVSSPALHQLLDEVEAEVLADDAALAEYVPPRAPSPWLHENGEWWPKADAS
jgi:hypothetical protein